MKEELVEEGITIGELFAIVWARKIIIAAITILVTIAAALFFMLYSNPKSVMYEATFDLTFPGIEENKYPSGYTFNYNDLIADENIEIVKSNNLEKFSNIVVEELSNSSISIKENTSFSVFEGQTFIPSIRNFTIVCNGNLFDNSTDAALFIEELLNVTLENIVGGISKGSYYTYITNSTSSVSYENELALLSQQITYLTTSYENLFEEYGDIVISDKSLLEIQTNFLATNHLLTLSILSNELNSEYYLKTDKAEAKTYLLSEQYVLENQINTLDAKITALEEGITNMDGATDAYTIILADLRLERVELMLQTSIITEKLAAIEGDQIPDNTTFSANVELLRESLKSSTDEYVEILNDIYNSESKVYFSNRAIVSTYGTTNVMFVALVAMVFSGGASCVGFIALDLIKKNKKEVEAAK